MVVLGNIFLLKIMFLIVTTTKQNMVIIVPNVQRVKVTNRQAAFVFYFKIIVYEL